MGLDVTETTVAKTEWMHSLDLSDSSAAGVNNATQNVMDLSIEDFAVPKELKNTYRQVPHIVSFFRDDSVKVDRTRGAQSIIFLLGILSHSKLTIF